MIADKSYNTVLDDYESKVYMYWEWSDRRKVWALNYGTNSYDLHFMLKHFGIKSNMTTKRFTDYEDLPETAILCVDRRREKVGGKTNTHWHWVVWHNNDIYDPWNGYCDQYFWDNMIWSYIRIH